MEQEDSDNTLTESEQWLCEKQKTSIGDNQSSNKTEGHDKYKIPETKMSEQDINHTEEVIIGTGQGKPFLLKLVLQCVMLW